MIKTDVILSGSAFRWPSTRRLVAVGNGCARRNSNHPCEICRNVCIAFRRRRNARTFDGPQPGSGWNCYGYRRCGERRRYPFWALGGDRQPGQGELRRSRGKAGGAPDDTSIRARRAPGDYVEPRHLGQDEAACCQEPIPSEATVDGQKVRGISKDCICNHDPVFRPKTKAGMKVPSNAPATFLKPSPRVACQHPSGLASLPTTGRAIRCEGTSPDLFSLRVRPECPWRVGRRRSIRVTPQSRSPGHAAIHRTTSFGGSG
jgi:hypothetical protein